MIRQIDSDSGLLGRLIQKTLQPILRSGASH